MMDTCVFHKDEVPVEGKVFGDTVCKECGIELVGDQFKTFKEIADENVVKSLQNYKRGKAK